MSREPRRRNGGAQNRRTLLRRTAARSGVLLTGFLPELALVLLVVAGLMVAVALAGSSDELEEIASLALGPQSGRKPGADIVPVYSLSVWPAGREILVRNQRHELVAHDLENGEVLSRETYMRQLPACLACSPDHRLVFVGCYDGSILLFRDGVEEPFAREDSEAPVTAAAVSHDATRLATGRQDGSVQVWDTATGRRLLEWRVGAEAVSCIRFSPDGSGLAVADGGLSYCDLSPPVRPRRIGSHAEAVRLCVFLECGTRLVSGGADGRLRLWDVAEGTELWNSGGLDSMTSALAAAPDGRTLACGHLDGTIRFWDTRRLVCEQAVDAHPRGTSCLAYADDGRLVSAGFEGTLALWDASTLNELKRIGWPH